MSTKLAAYLMLSATMLVCGMSTGAQAYYLVAFTLLALLLVSFISALWVYKRGFYTNSVSNESLLTYHFKNLVTDLSVGGIFSRQTPAWSKSSLGNTG